MKVSVTINLADDEIEQDVEVETLQQAFDDSVQEYPRWTSMVLIVVNPNRG